MLTPLDLGCSTIPLLVAFCFLFYRRERASRRTRGEGGREERLQYRRKISSVVSFLQQWSRVSTCHMFFDTNGFARAEERGGE